MQGTASSEAKRKELLAKQAREQAEADTHMVKIDPDELAQIRAELDRLQALVLKLQGNEAELEKLRRTVEQLR